MTIWSAASRTNNYNDKLSTLEFLDLVKSKLEEHLGITVPRHEFLQRSLGHVDPMLSTYIQQYLNPRIGVVSFSVDPLVPTMWAHYAQSTGIVVGYDTQALRQMGLELKTDHLLRDCSIVRTSEGRRY